MCTGTMKLRALELGSKTWQPHCIIACTKEHCIVMGKGQRLGQREPWRQELVACCSHLVDQRAQNTSSGHRLQDTSPADLCQTCLLSQKLHNLPKQGDPLGNQILKLVGLLGTFYIQTGALHLYRKRSQQWATWPFKNLCLVTKPSHCLATLPPF